MKNIFKVIVLLCFTLPVFPSIGLAQSKQQGMEILKQANELKAKSGSSQDMVNALKKYEEALGVFEMIGSDKEKGITFNQIGLVYKSMGEHSKALEYYDKSLAIKQKLGDLKGEGVTLGNIGAVYEAMAQHSKALGYYEKGLAIKQKLGDEKGERVALNNIGSVLKSTGEYSKALEYYEKALAIDQKLSDEKGEGVSLGNIGVIYYSMAQYSKALEYCEKALAIKQKLGDEKGERVALNNIGSVLKSTGEYSKALEYYEKALAIDKKIGDEKSRGLTLNNIGSVYDSWAQHSKALEYYEKALTIRQKLGDVKGEGVTLHSTGKTYYFMGEYSKALEYYNKSLAIDQKLGDVKGEGSTLNSIGSVYEALAQYSKALDYYEKSLAICQKTGDLRVQGITLNNIGIVYKTLGQYRRTLEYYEKSLTICQKIGDVKTEGVTLGNIGSVHATLGQYQKSLEYFEKSLAIKKKIGDVHGEGITLNNIGLVNSALGQYRKTLEYYEKSLAISQRIGDVKNEGVTLSNIGSMHATLGHYQKSLEYFEKSLAIKKKIGDVHGEGAALFNLGETYVQMGKYDDAFANTHAALEIFLRLNVGTPIRRAKDSIGNLYLDIGELNKSEAFIKQAGYDGSLARLYLLRSNYPNAKSHYDKLLAYAEKNQETDHLFTAYTGLGKVYEALADYKKSEECYEKGMRLTEEIRSGLTTSERKNFFEVKIKGFYRSEPAKGLTRVRMKLNQADASVAPSELTKARSFADHLSQTNATGATSIPSSLLEKEQSCVNQLAALKKDLAGTYPEKAPDKFKNLSQSVKDAKEELNSFVNKLWKDYPAYAAVKYPRPPTLKDSALSPEEYAVIFDVSSEGVGVILIRDKVVRKAFYLDFKLTDLERDVMKFREPFEKLRLKDYEPKLGKAIYDKLLRPVLVDVPKGAPLIIMPDGILAMLPLEALVTGGEATWHKSSSGLDYPEGLTFLGDEHPISYYQSVTALTLVRTIGNKEKPKDSLLVVADPVFSMKDQRAQKASETRLSQREKEYNIQRMAAIEDVSGPLFPQLPETGKLAGNLSAMYGTNCLSVTGLNAEKLDFLAKIAPRMDQYGNVVFATHGVMGNKVPGVREPFLALTMVPPGTDGFLKMSDILALKMNSDIVALTACETGLGKDVSGEGVMSMGRAFQYAGVRSVLMSLWSVADVSSVKLTESFFRHRKSGKSKLESLKLAREEIRKQGFEHPFFWAAFILVGEVN